MDQRRQPKQWQNAFPETYKVIVSQSEPRKGLLEHLIDQLDMQPQFPHERMVGPVEVSKLDRGVDRGEE